MNEVTTIGLDLAKNVFQVHGVDASGRAVVRRQLRRSQVLPFFERGKLRALSALKPAPPRITGRGRSLTKGVGFGQRP
jgi:transposase